ncbi:MAG: dihydropteroate synthase [Victivallaceae bacterium]|nr:dihydropteroate synthase [Victivallaceae bacterium]
MSAFFPGSEMPLVMGILNVTDDSFSDTGRGETRPALERAAQMRSEEADILDIGGESTRPGAAEVPVEEELSRVIPAIRAIRAADPAAVLSIDTRKSAVAQQAVAMGASWINDVSGLSFDPAIADVAAQTGAKLVITHAKGTPETMDGRCDYPGGVLEEVLSFWKRQVAYALSRGVKAEQIVLDPGIGFAKTGAQNWQLLRAVESLKAPGYPLLMGCSRKRFLGELTGEEDPRNRDAATAALTGYFTLHKVEVVRVHNVGISVAERDVWRKLAK